jgi:integrase
MAVRKQRRLDGTTGNVEKSDSWYIYFHDHHRREHSFSAGTDRGEALKLEGRIRDVVRCRKNGFYPPDVSDWLDALPSGLRKKLAKWDLLPGGLVAAGVPISEHLQDWRTHLVASGVSGKQADLLYARCERVFSEAGFKYLPDMVSSKVLNTIDRLAKLLKTKAPKTGEITLVKTDKRVSSNTKLHHVRAVKQFSKWLKSDGRTSSNPLDALAIRGAVVENKRRSLTEAEIVYLLGYTATAGDLQGLSGRERSLIYRVAIETGLRASEIASLNRTSFDFDGLSVKVKAEHTKNKKAALLPVKATTMAMVRDFLKVKTPTAAAFGLKVSEAARMIQADMADARQQWIAAVKDYPAEHRRRAESDFLAIKTDKGKIDFHSLRHSFGTMLAAAGVHPRTAMELMRHSKIELTMGIYTTRKMKS